MKHRQKHTHTRTIRARSTTGVTSVRMREKRAFSIGRHSVTSKQEEALEEANIIICFIVVCVRIVLVANPSLLAYSLVNIVLLA